MRYHKLLALLLTYAIPLSLCACSQNSHGSEDTEITSAAADAEKKAYIEETLNLANKANQSWTYGPDADAWALSIVSTVAYLELPDQQGVSVCVPGAYVTGIDTNGDGTSDLTAGAAGTDTVFGSLVIDYESEVTSTNG